MYLECSETVSLFIKMPNKNAKKRKETTQKAWKLNSIDPKNKMSRSSPRNEYHKIPKIRFQIEAGMSKI